MELGALLFNQLAPTEVGVTGLMMEVAACLSAALTQSQTLMQSLGPHWLVQSYPEPWD